MRIPTARLVLLLLLLLGCCGTMAEAVAAGFRRRSCRLKNKVNQLLLENVLETDPR